jgi:hypothetical protein
MREREIEREREREKEKKKTLSVTHSFLGIVPLLTMKLIF